MTEVVILTAGAPVVIAGVATLAALDPSITNIVLALIAAVGNLAALHYGYKNLVLNKKCAEQDARLKALQTPIKEKEKLP